MVAMVAAVVLATALFRAAGRFLVLEDAFEHADVAVVLSGDPARRTLGARDLYRAGRAGRILVVPEPRTPPLPELVALGIVDPASPPISERILQRSAVPAGHVAFLPAPADGTIVEAYRVRAFLGDRPPARIAVVTGRAASRRACFVFRWVLRGTKIHCAPTPYDTFRGERWWSEPRTALLVVTEYQKLAANVVALALGVRPK